MTELDATCIFCSGRHFSTNRDCPEQSRQKMIKLVMSQDNISFLEASSRFPAVRNTFAAVSQALFTPPSPSFRPCSTLLAAQTQSSHRKTVVRSPRPRSPSSGGYDVRAHKDIVAPVSSSLPNGCALQSSPSVSNENLVEILISTLLSIVSKTSNPLPSHVADKLKLVISLINNGPEVHSMEQ